jgi:hypothetical protein
LTDDFQPLPPGERTQMYLTKKKPDDGKEEKEPSKKRGGSVF